MRFSLFYFIAVNFIFGGTAAAFAATAVETLPSGVRIEKIVANTTGAYPRGSDIVLAHYRGTRMDGTEFDSSYSRHGPSMFALHDVIPCWSESIIRMRVGEKIKLICPADTAYGSRGVPGDIAPDSILNFEIELLKIET